jgi:hypothetical protein
LIKGIRDQKRQMSEIKQLNDEYRLIDLVLENLKIYLEKVGSQPDAWNKPVFGRFSHEYNLRIRLQFIEFLMLHSTNGLELTEENIKEL